MSALFTKKTNLLALPLALMAIAAMAPQQAKADCVLSLGVVTCTGTDADGFGTGTENLLLVNVEADALVIGPGSNGLSLNAANAINVFGTIDAAFAGVSAGAENVIVNGLAGQIFAGGSGIGVTDANDVTNFGALSVNGTGILAGSNNAQDYNVDGDVGLTNRGSILAFNGIGAVDGNVITNIGSITATNTGILAGANNAITNSGSILADGDGINATTGNIIKNTSSMSIVAGVDGIEVGDGNDVTNTGAITAANAFGIIAGSNNFQDFDVDGDAGIVNRGTIDAAVGIGALDNNIIVNDGTITTTAQGILAGANNSITNDGTIDSDGDGISATTGNIVKNTSADTIISDANGIVVTDNNDVLNSGRIEALSGTGIVAGAGNFQDFDLDGNAGIVSSGSIESMTGIAAGGGNIVTVDGGTIDASATGVAVDGDNTLVALVDGASVAGGADGITVNNDVPAGFGNAIDVFEGSTVVGEAGAAIAVTGAGATFIDNTGVLMGTAPMEGDPVVAISGAEGAETLNNFGGGLVMGNVALGGGSDNIVLEAGSIIDGDIDMGESEGDLDNLTLTGDGPGVFNGDATGIETLDQNGTGTFTLNGMVALEGGPSFGNTIDIDTDADGIPDDTFQSFIAPIATTLNAGRLDIGGVDDMGAPITTATLISPEVDILPGATLGGHGTIITDPANFGSVFVSGFEADPFNPTGLQGSIAPGTSIGTLTVQGTVIFTSLATGTFEVLVDDDMDPETPDVLQDVTLVTNNGGRFEAELNDAGQNDLLNVLAVADVPATQSLDVPVDTTGPDGVPDGVFDGTEPQDFPTNNGVAVLGGTLDVVLDGEFVADDPATEDVDESRDADGNLIPQADYGAAAQTYDVIIAENGVSGTFDEISFSGGPNDGAIVLREDDPETVDVDETVRQQVFKGHLDYLTDRVRITSIPEFARAATTDNQASVAAALDASVPYGLSLDPFTDAMAQLGLSGDIPGGLDDLHGEWFNAFNEVGIGLAQDAVDQVSARALEARSGVRGPTTASVPLSGAAAGQSGAATSSTLWIAGSFAFVDVEPSNGFLNFDYESINGYLGFDFQFGDNLIVGLMSGFGNTEVDFDGRRGEGDVDSWQVAGYVSYFGPEWYATVTGGFRDLGIDSIRDITFGTVDLDATAEWDGTVIYVAGEVGYRFDLGNSGWDIAPELGLMYTNVEQDSILEGGAGPLNLSIDEQDNDSFRMSAQVRFSRPMTLGSGALVVPFVRVGIAHEFEDDPRAIIGRIDGQTPDFTVWGDVAAGTTAIFGAGISGEISDGISLFLNYAGEVGGSLSDHAISGGARIAF